MNVCVFNTGSKLPISIESVKALVAEVISYEGQSCQEISIHFVSIPEICDLHDQYFNDPSPTDCISFPLDEDEDEQEEYRMLGDVFVCPEVAIEYGASHQIDPYEETSLYVVHGILHLFGYDDIEESDEVKMRAAETRHMLHLKAGNLLIAP